VIRTKREMYRMLVAGEFGNTIPQYFSLEDWLISPDHAKYSLWGVRSISGGGDKRMRLNVPRDDVKDYCERWYPHGGVNISPMIDRYAVLRAEAFESGFGEPFGLNVFYVPPGKLIPADPWRGSFKRYGTRAWGLKALHLLREHLWPSDWEDLRLTLDRFPGHVVEFSACDRAVGVIPNRNCVIWECRAY